MKISDSIRYVGADDTTLDLFEGQYPVPFGVSYNSYVIFDQKTAVMDTVDKRAIDEWLQNLKDELGDRKPDYLVVQHLEPDHSGGIEELCRRFPDMQVVCSAKAAGMLPQFLGIDLGDRVHPVKEGDTLSLGSHTLHFVMAPMVHWPEVMMTYEDSEKVLFSADAFGTFGALNSHINWLVEARRYYINIVGKYGPSVQTVLKKAAALDIAKILPLHGPVLDEDLGKYIGFYDTWSKYEPERKGILVAYASAHGNTKEAALHLAKKLEEAGEMVITIDLSRDDMARAVEGAYCFDRMVLASITYDGNLFPPMQDFLYHLSIKNFQKRTVGLIENGSWAPVAAKKMREELEKDKDITILDPVVTIRTRRHESDEAQFEALKDALVAAGK